MPVFMYGEKAILTFILKGGACVWWWGCGVEPVSGAEVIRWSLCLVAELWGGACVYVDGACVYDDGACVLI